jgi:hypothetical protein
MGPSVPGALQVCDFFALTVAVSSKTAPAPEGQLLVAGATPGQPLQPPFGLVWWKRVVAFQLAFALMIFAEADLQEKEGDDRDPA